MNHEMKYALRDRSDIEKAGQRNRAKERYARIVKLRENEPSFTTGRGVTKAFRSHSEVAAILGTSRQNVQQLERMALFKLRRALAPLLQEINPELFQEIFQ